MAFCFSIPAVLFQHHLSRFDITLRYFGHLPFVFLPRAVLLLLLCPRFVAFSLIFPLALSFFKEICPFSSRFVCLRGRKTPAFLFSTPDKVEIGTNSKQKHPVKLIFSAQNEILGEDFSRTEEKNAPKKVDFIPKVAESDEKGWFWGRNHREGMKRKIELYCRFCNAMK